MGLRQLGAIGGRLLKRTLSGGRPSSPTDVPKGHFPIYVGDDNKRFVVPIAFLEHPSFQNLLKQAEEDLDVDHQAKALKVPCGEGAFLALVNQLSTFPK